jgi:hypothetical protein
MNRGDEENHSVYNMCSFSFREVGHALKAKISFALQYPLTSLFVYHHKIFFSCSIDNIPHHEIEVSQLHRTKGNLCGAFLSADH